MARICIEIIPMAAKFFDVTLNEPFYRADYESFTTASFATSTGATSCMILSNSTRLALITTIDDSGIATRLTIMVIHGNVSSK